MGSAGAHVTALQERLKELGYGPGRADGHYGNRTRDAVLAFQADRGLKVDGMAGRLTFEELDKDGRRPANHERTEATTQTLLDDGSIIADASVKGQGAGGALVLGGGLTALSQVMDVMAPLKALFADYGLWIAVAVLVGVGGYVLWQNRRALLSRIEMRRTGEMG